MSHVSESKMVAEIFWAHAFFLPSCGRDPVLTQAVPFLSHCLALTGLDVLRNPDHSSSQRRRNQQKQLCAKSYASNPPSSDTPSIPLSIRLCLCPSISPPSCKDKVVLCKKMWACRQITGAFVSLLFFCSFSLSLREQWVMPCIAWGFLRTMSLCEERGGKKSKSDGCDKKPQQHRERRKWQAEQTALTPKGIIMLTVL